MGTRHLIAVMHGGEYKVAQYGQWDGYPSGQGLDVLNFLQAKMDRALFEAKLKDVSFISQEELTQRWLDAGADPDSSWVTMQVAETMKSRYPENSRDTGSEILTIIQDADRPIKIVNSLDFAGDSVFCEWGYVIDLDKNTFEVYKGFNEISLTESDRFHGMPSSNDNHHPIRLLKSFDLNSLPTEEVFIEELDTLREAIA